MGLILLLFFRVVRRALLLHRLPAVCNDKRALLGGRRSVSDIQSGSFDLL